MDIFIHILIQIPTEIGLNRNTEANFRDFTKDDL